MVRTGNGSLKYGILKKMKAIKIALLGSLPKGDEVRKDWVDWKVTYETAIKKKIPGAKFIHGDTISDNAGAIMVVGHDLAQVKQADICVVDARTKVGAGTAQEMVLAKYFDKPVVAIIPKGTHHRKTDVMFHGVLMDEWIHPFLRVSSDHVAESIEAAAEWIADYIASPQKYQIKNLTVFDHAIDKFTSTLK